MKYLLVFFLFINLSSASQQNVAKFDSIYQQADNYLRDSKPDIAIPLILEVISDNSYNPYQITKSKILLSEAYRLKKDFTKGEEILQLILNQPTLSDSNIAYTYNRLAANIAENNKRPLSRYKIAIEYSKKSISISKNIRWDKMVYISYNELAYAYFKLDNTTESLRYYQLALDGFKDIYDTLNFVNTSINISALYSRKLSNYDKSLAILKAAKQMCNCDNHLNMKMRLYLELGDLYRYKNDYKNAYKYTNKARILQKDDLLNRMNSQIEDVSARYNLKIKSNKINQIESENIHKKQQIIVLIIILILAIIMIVVLVRDFILKKKILVQKRLLLDKENENLKLDIEFKNKELVSNAIVLARQIEFNLKIAKDIKNVYPAANAKMKRDLMLIIRELNSKKNNSIWKEFDTRFSQTHEYFYQSLITNYSNLSPSEIKICAFLKLNMSSKDIASLTNRSIRTIENTRLSIRKKLGIASDTNLVSFLLEL